MSIQSSGHTRKSLGAEGEQAVTRYIADKGYTIVAHNVRWKGGEIDIIAEKNSTIACIEVKTRRSSYFPLSTVITPTKQQRIINTARYYIATHQLYNRAVRFDVALVELHLNSDERRPSWHITYLENAFQPSDQLLL